MTPENEIHVCPECSIENADNWPINVDGEVKEGGCQECWEKDSDAQWWGQVRLLQGLYGRLYL